MPERIVLPYRYPTTVVAVDDDPHLLGNLRLGLDEELACRIFHSPRAALTFLEHERDRHDPPHLRCFRGEPDEDAAPSFDPAAIAEQLCNPARFSEVSVLLVDYAMAEMDGLTFCRQVSDPHIKKILFTGVGDERIAVDAFNEGLIDRFIRKGALDALARVNRAVAELQRAYFEDVSRLVHHSVARGQPNLLDDGAFAAYFAALCRNHGIVEHYYLTEPAGFLLVDAGGASRRLLVLDEELMTAHYEIAQDQGAPTEFLNLLARREAVPYLPRGNGYYQRELEDWRPFMHPVTVIEGRQDYFAAVVEDSRRLLSLPCAVTSYEAYLDTFAEGPAAPAPSPWAG